MSFDTLIRIFATAMALATSGLVHGATPTPVQAGSPVQVTGILSVGCVSACTRAPSAIVHTFATPLFATDTQRPIERMQLVDGGVGVDMVRLAQVLPVDTKITVNGTFVRQGDKVTKLPLHTADMLQVAQLKIDGIDLVKPTDREARRISKIAAQRLVQYAHELHPPMANGPAIEIDGVEVLTNDHAVVTVHAVTGWTNLPIPGTEVRALVVLSGDDQIHMIQGSLK